MEILEIDMRSDEVCADFVRGVWRQTATVVRGGGKRAISLIESNPMSGPQGGGLDVLGFAELSMYRRNISFFLRSKYEKCTVDSTL